MRLVLRLWLTIVLGIALPLQGVTAATMFHCVPAQQQAGASADAHDHAQHLAGGMRDAGHHAPTAAADEPAADASQQPQPQQQSATKCSACAACCASAALPSALMVFSSPELVQSFTRSMASRVAAFVTQGLERPPRPLLA